MGAGRRNGGSGAARHASAALVVSAGLPVPLVRAGPTAPCQLPRPARRRVLVPACRLPRPRSRARLCRVQTSHQPPRRARLLPARGCIDIDATMCPADANAAVRVAFKQAREDAHTPGRRRRVRTLGGGAVKAPMIPWSPRRVA